MYKQYTSMLITTSLFNTSGIIALEGKVSILANKWNLRETYPRHCQFERERKRMSLLDLKQAMARNEMAMNKNIGTA